MKDKSKVKPKNVWKVAEILANNPHTTHRELQKEAWLASNTIQKAKDELKRSWILQKIKEEYEKRQKIISDDIKDSIDNDLIADFVVQCWSKSEATRQIEEYLRVSLWKDKRRRKGIWDNTRYSILHKFWFKCCACGAKPQKDNNIVLHIDHIIPFSMWWLDVENNYQVLCEACNISKWNDFNYNHTDD